MLPMVILIWDWSQGNLSANPIQDATLRTGRFALILLILSLAITPLNSLFDRKLLVPLRKWFGLYSAFYAGVHFLIFIGVDYGFNLHLIQADLLTKKYVIMGFLAGLILLLLTLTSTQGWQRRLGMNWKRLHRFVYLAGIFAVTHYIMLVLRIPIVRRYLNELRHLWSRLSRGEKGVSP
jgi:sulfoxide reductase heme-binding subunit YedZ